MGRGPVSYTHLDVYKRQLQGRVGALYTGAEEGAAAVLVALPRGMEPEVLPEGWRREAAADGAVLRWQGTFRPGYENWFALLSLRVAPGLPPGDYRIETRLTCGAEEAAVVSVVRVAAAGERSGAPPEISGVLLPFDPEGGADARMDSGTLLLRDAALAYYKSLLKGRGAVNAAAESTHPLTHMAVTFANPARQPQLLLVRARLLDQSGAPVPGFVNPESNASEEGGQDGGLRAAHEAEETLTALAALDGSPRQRADLPVYADESALKSGRYLLEVAAYDGAAELARYRMSLEVVARDHAAALTTALAFLGTCAGLLALFARSRLRRVKPRVLITAGLFGTTAFAAVNVPGTFLNDLLHIALGPLSFLVSGLFSGVLLYMLLSSLFVLFPQRGVIALMLLVRMLLGMLVFGRVSPVSFLFYGAQAVLLEGTFWLAGVTRGGAARPVGRAFVLTVALACGVADALSAYVNLQALSFLYRLYYADWYIAMNCAVGGFLYAAVGAAGGVLLGKALKKVGVD